MWRKLLATNDDVAALITRLALGLVMFPHGAQKVPGRFGGSGFSATMQAFTEGMRIPLVFAFLAIVAECFGSIALVLGFLGRLAAFGIGCVMVVAAYLESNNGFFMNWSGEKAGEGIEYHLLAVAMCLVVMLRGGGRWSVDRVLTITPAARAG